MNTSRDNLGDYSDDSAFRNMTSYNLVRFNDNFEDDKVLGLS
jgi:hypothetical protein